jgi:predicted ATP-grasp superfamily ATP-dependent carboligase
MPTRKTNGIPIACVLGEVDLLRALRLARIPSTIVAQEGNPALYSRAATTAIGWIDPWREPEALVERLVAFGHRQPRPPVLYYDGDWDLLLVSRYRNRLAQAFRFVVPDAELVESVVDKALFQGLAEHHRLPVPRSVKIAADDDPSAGIDLDFPVVVKPVTRQNITWEPLSDLKALHVTDADELRSVRRRLAVAGVDVIVQEAIAGPDSRIESYHVYIDERGAIAGEFTGRKLRVHPPGYGHTTALTITRNEQLAALGRQIVDRIGLRGVAKLDFKSGPDGRMYLFEINARFNLWHHPGAVAGVNLPALVYADLVGLPRPAQRQVREGVTWCTLRHDFQAARAEGMTILGCLRTTAASDAKSGFAWDDPLPLPRAAAWQARRWLRARAGRYERD